MEVPEVAKKVGRGVVKALRFTATGVCEKDEDKTEHMGPHLILSASRVVVLALVTVWVKIVWTEPALLKHWPVATAGVFFAVALPIVGALKRTKPERVLDWAKGLAEQLGQGD